MCWQRPCPWCAVWAAELKRLFAVYVEAKQRQNVLDYDDLLLYWAQMVSDPGLAGEIGERFDHVLVDEYQEMEIEKWRPETGAQNPPRTDRNAKIAGQRLGTPT